jgi:hypothetical protein
MPKFAADERHVRAIDQPFLLGHAAAQNRLNAKRAEQRRRHADARQSLRIAARVGQIHFIAPVARESFQQTASILPVVEIGGRYEVALHAGLGLLFEKIDQAARFPIRQGFDQDRFDDAKDGGVSANAEGQGNNRDRIKRRS